MVQWFLNIWCLCCGLLYYVTISFLILSHTVQFLIVINSDTKSYINILSLIFNSNPYQENDERDSSDEELKENKEKMKVW